MRMNYVSRVGLARLVDDDGHVRVGDYQRGASRERINKLAAGWDADKVGVIVVAPRGSSYVVLDGQHRVAAAHRRGDVDSLPCLVVHCDEDTEAKLWVALNAERAAPSSYAKFRAKLLAGDAVAMQVSELLRQHGYMATSHGNRKNCVTAVGALESVARKHGSRMVDQILGISRAAFDGAESSVTSAYVRAMAHLLTARRDATTEQCIRMFRRRRSPARYWSDRLRRTPAHERGQMFVVAFDSVDTK